VTALRPGRRVLVSEFGETPLDALDHHLRLEDQAPPDPAALAPDEIILEIRSAGVGWVDLLMTSGQYQHLVAPPYCPGNEYAGVVVAKGAAVSSLELGQRVLADGLRVGPRSKGRYQKWGGFASYAVIPADAVFPLPERWSFDQGCNLLGNYETAYHCLITCGRLQAGETVLINGASGATGLAAVHLAKIVGATVIATGRSAQKLEQVRAQGADHVLTTGDGFRDQVKALTQGRGADVIYDGVGGDISVESMRAACFGARYLIVGWASTPFVARGKGKRGAPNVNRIPTNLILMKGLQVLGCPTAIATHRDPSIRGPRLTRIMGWVEDGRIDPHVAQVFSLTDFDAAMRAKWASQAVGGIVVRPSFD